MAPASIAVLVLSLLLVAGPDLARARDTNVGRAGAYDQQRQCGQDAQRFYALWQTKSGTGPASLSSWFENHYNSQLNKCFVLLFYHDLADDFLSIDLYDAHEQKHYAEFFGHSICDPDVSKMTHKVGRCVPDSVNIWLQGDDQEDLDVHFGWSGLLHGAHPGGPETKVEFMYAIQPFMNN